MSCIGLILLPLLIICYMLVSEFFEKEKWLENLSKVSFDLLFISLNAHPVLVSLWTSFALKLPWSAI